MITLEERSLDNGLRVVLAPDRSTPVVGVNLWYAVGSRNEVRGRTGFAHLFEHMMFQGSAHVEKNGHFEHIEQAGGSANATTWFDRTNYYETLPSHHLEVALWLESDRMGWMLPALTTEKLENQRAVVMNERRQRYDNQPYGDWDERVQALLFPENHPYHHTVIGSMEDIAAATMEDVQQFFQTFYVPNNAVLTLTGDFEPDPAFSLVQKHFAEIPRGAIPPAIPGDPLITSSLDGPVRTRVVSPVPLPRVYMAYRVPPFTTDEYYAGDLAAYCLGSGRASRFYDRLVRGSGIAKSASAHLLPLTSGATMFLVVVNGYPGRGVEELQAGVFEEVAALDSLEESELERAVALVETGILRELQQVGTKADLLSMYATLFGDAERLNQDLRRARSVSVDEIRAYARDYLRPDNCVIVEYLPESAP